jgi:hypothetical protein
MRAFEASQLSTAPRYVLGDDVLRVPARSYHPRGSLSDDGTTLTLVMSWGLLEIDIESWRQRAVYRHDTAAQEIATIPKQLCSFLLPDDEHLLLLAPNGARSRLRVPMNAANGALPMLSLTRPDELYLHGRHTVTRWRCVRGELELQATFSSHGRHDFGDEILGAYLSPDGTRLYLRTRREVLALDAISLELQCVVLDLNVYFNQPKAWVDMAEIQTVTVERQRLYIMLQIKKVWATLLLECSLDGEVMRTLRSVDGVYFDTMSPVLPGERMLLGSVFHGTALVDVKGWTWLEHAKTLGGSFAWMDVKHSRAYGFKQDGTFHSINASGKLLETTHEGEIERHDLAWNTRHLVALSQQRGVELFATPGASPTTLPQSPEWLSQLRLSQDGRWALHVHEGVLTVQDTRGDVQNARRPLPANSSVNDIAIDHEGTLWWWNKRELSSERGAKITVSKRDAWGSLHESPEGSRLLLRVSKELLVIDTKLATILSRLPAPKLENSAFANEQTLVVIGNDGLRWYDTSNGVLLHWHKRRLTDANMMDLAVSPGGELVAIAKRGMTEVELIPRDAPKDTTRSVIGQGVKKITFSPDGLMLAVSCEESPIRVFAVEDLRKATVQKKKRRNVTDV